MAKSGFDIDELERLLAAATPGEWVQPFDNSATVDSSNGHTLIYDEGGFTQYDAALIVAARNSLPTILTEIRELRAENARLRLDVETQEALQVSAYHAGLRAGWNFGVSDDNAGMQAAMANTDHIKELRRIREARAVLGEPQ